jgi:hypothetical protein
MVSILKRFAAPSLSAILFIAGCQSDDTPVDAPAPISQVAVPVWVAIEPTQCLTNPWEADWLAHHGNDYASYPKDYSRPGLEPGEVTIIKDYYRRQSVVVSGTATAAKYIAVCASCSCPEGHTMFLRVREQDVDTMIALGYRLESPGPD